MELGSIIHFLQDKTILVTGATGFLAKSLYLSLSQSLSVVFLLLSLVIVLLILILSDISVYFPCSFCGKNIEGSTKCEETLSAFES